MTSVRKFTPVYVPKKYQKKEFFTFYFNSDCAPARFWHGLQSPDKEMIKEVKVASLAEYDAKCSVKKIMELIEKEEPGEFFVRASYDNYDGSYNMSLVREIKVPNPNYKRLLASYNQRQKQFDEETKIFEELTKLYEEWNKERSAKNSPKDKSNSTKKRRFLKNLPNFMKNGIKNGQQKTHLSYTKS